MSDSDQTTPVSDLTQKTCTPCEGGVPKRSAQQTAEYLKQVEGWAERDGEISRTFKFKDFYQTMAFVNAVAWVANTENHHPDMEVGYSQCAVRYSTHAVGGLTENDFICAAKINALLSEA